MIWFVALGSILCGLSFALLAASGAETPHFIQTFTQTSQAERQFNRRGMVLQTLGLISLALAAADGGLAFYWLR